MVKEFFAQLENLARRVQVRHLKKIYPDGEGLKFGEGSLWQHPGRFRGDLLKKFEQRIQDLDKTI